MATLQAVTLACLLVTVAQAILVNVTSEWRSELGWEVQCDWQTLPEDTLQSVRLYSNGQQFLIYRPENHGQARNEVFRTPEKVMNVECHITTDRGQEGRCVLVLEPYQPPVNDFTYTCEVSGERPFFRMGSKDYLVKALVPPTDAVLTSSVQDNAIPTRVALNCSSAGLPAPSLQWTVGEDKVPADFTGRVWNATSKLWHVWSYLSYTKTDGAKVLCTPEVLSHKNIIKGEPAEFKSNGLRFDTNMSLIAVLTAFSLLR